MTSKQTVKGRKCVRIFHLTNQHECYITELCLSFGSSLDCYSFTPLSYLLDFAAWTEHPQSSLERARLRCKIANTLCSGPPQGALTSEANKVIVQLIQDTITKEVLIRVNEARSRSLLARAAQLANSFSCTETCKHDKILYTRTTAQQGAKTCSHVGPLHRETPVRLTELRSCSKQLVCLGSPNSPRTVQTY